MWREKGAERRRKEDAGIEKELKQRSRPRRNYVLATTKVETAIPRKEGERERGREGER